MQMLIKDNVKWAEAAAGRGKRRRRRSLDWSSPHHWSLWQCTRPSKQSEQPRGGDGVSTEAWPGLCSQRRMRNQ